MSQRQAPQALSQAQIVAKLNSVPSFTIVDTAQQIFPLRDESGAEFCVWYTDPSEAKGALVHAKAQHPEADLHLGVTPLGVAFALVVGWRESKSAAALRLQSSLSVTQPVEQVLQEQLSTQGLALGTWRFPIFCCDQLQTQTMMPCFLSRNDLAKTWAAAGRSIASIPDSVTVVDLRVLVHQMQTDTFNWDIVSFVASQRAVDLVREAKADGPPVDPEAQPPPLE